MLTPIYGLTDVPRACLKTLHRFLIQWFSRRQFDSGPELYCVRTEGGWCQRSILQRASEHNEEQREFGKFCDAGRRAYVPGYLQYLLSVHVDVVKCIVVREAA